MSLWVLLGIKSVKNAKKMFGVKRRKEDFDLLGGSRVPSGVGPDSTGRWEEVQTPLWSGGGGTSTLYTPLRLNPGGVLCQRISVGCMCGGLQVLNVGPNTKFENRPNARNRGGGARGLKLNLSCLRLRMRPRTSVIPQPFRSISGFWQ